MEAPGEFKSYFRGGREREREREKERMGILLLTLLIVLGTVLLRAAYNTISCYWLTPRRIKKIMENQGVRGPKPRFLVGNIMDMAALVSKSTSTDMDSISHDTVGRLLPHFVAWSKQYGTNLFLFLLS